MADDDYKDNKPLTTEDLYGIKNSEDASAPEPPGIAVEETPDNLEEQVQKIAAGREAEAENHKPPEQVLPDPLAVPEIEPPANPILADPSGHPQLERPHSKTGNRKSWLVNLFIFGVLFMAGIGISLGINYFSARHQPVVEGDRQYIETIPPETTPVPVGPSENYKIYRILNSSRQPTGYRIKIPPDMLEPICDGSACMSSGTYMAGGSRLTVAVKPNPVKEGDFDNLIVTDAIGNKFDTQTATVSGMPARQYQSESIGTTAGGYRFTRIRGFMIKTPDNLLIEINHFAPAGITTDFEADAAVFRTIINSLEAQETDQVSGLNPTTCLENSDVCDPQSCSFEPGLCPSL